MNKNSTISFLIKPMIEIKVTGCQNCPFMNSCYDDFAMGDPNTYHCNILQGEWRSHIVKNNSLHLMDYFISFYKNGNVKSKNKKTLDNCPLLQDSINIIQNI